jgi:hypothetical protein
MADGLFDGFLDRAAVGDVERNGGDVTSATCPSRSKLGCSITS